MPAEPGDLHNAYRDMARRAAAAGVLPEGGLTPREQQGHLADETVPVDAGQVRRLVELLERCVYGRGGTDAELAEAIALCGAVAKALPDPPTPSRPRRRWRLGLDLRLAAGALSVVAVTGLLVLAIPHLVKMQLRMPSVSSTAWSSELAGERAAAGASANPGWSAPKASATYVTHRVPQTLTCDVTEPTAAPTIDQSTGVDARFLDDRDPFRPPLYWSHRRVVYDAVDANYRFLGTTDPLARPAIGPRGDRDLTHEVSVRVRLERGRAVPIPSPGPDAVVLEVGSRPPHSIDITLDASDGMHAVADRSGSVVLSYRTASRRAYRNAPLSTAPFVPVDVPLPPNVRADAAVVLATIGDIPGATYAETVRRLQSYFSGFVVAPIEPAEVQANDYLTVALARKGVCRHRARAFFVTANAAGVRTRLVENRIHSFCEVQQPDGSWRRMEFRLGADEGSPTGPGTIPVVEHPTAVVAGNTVLILSLFVLIAGLRAAFRADAVTHLVGAAHLADRSVAPNRRTVPGLLQLSLHRFRRWWEHRTVPTDEPPAPIRQRVRNLHAAENRSGTTPDARELQRIYWDSYHVLKWLREKREL